MGMRIAIDAMGGDRAPAAPVGGALRGLSASADLDVVLVGEPERIEDAIALHPQFRDLRGRIRIHDAPEVVGTHDDPVRKVRSSARVSARACADLLREGEVDGVLTMGSTGGAVAAATLYCRRLAGVRRLGIAVPFPRKEGVTVVLDCGANPDAKPAHLHQYAVMAVQYVRAAFGVASPRVGIPSIGEEEGKGNRLVAETWDRFRAHPIPGFIGNVEPREFFENKADVVVCDGFSGNVALKAVEGMAEYIMGGLRGVYDRDGGESLATALRTAGQRVDYAAYGGAPLLGVDGAYMIGHGRSTAPAFESGLRMIRSYITHDVGGKIVSDLASRAESDAAESTS